MIGDFQSSVTKKWFPKRQWQRSRIASEHSYQEISVVSESECKSWWMCPVWTWCWEYFKLLVSASSCGQCYCCQLCPSPAQLSPLQLFSYCFNSANTKTMILAKYPHITSRSLHHNWFAFYDKRHTTMNKLDIVGHRSKVGHHLVMCDHLVI